MNAENTQRIIAACPHLFSSMWDEQQRMVEGEMFSPIAFGFECGDGWADLLVELCERIQQHLNTVSDEYKEDMRASQVKEKYGTLRFYMSCSDEVIESLIEEYSKKSGYVCEQCGKPGHLRGSVWFYTACDAHTRDEDLDPLPESEMP